jgi:hypothetical protein
MNVETIEKYQRQFLEQSRRSFYKTPISQATERAYLATPGISLSGATASGERRSGVR